MKRMLAATVVFLLILASVLIFVPVVRIPVERSLFGEHSRPLSNLAESIKGVIGSDNAPESENGPESGNGPGNEHD